MSPDAYVTSRVLRKDWAPAVAERIRNLLQDKGMSERSLARAMGYTQASLNRKMLGQRQWTAMDLQCVATALGVEVDHLIETR